MLLGDSIRIRPCHRAPEMEHGGYVCISTVRNSFFMVLSIRVSAWATLRCNIEAAAAATNTTVS